MNSVAQRHGAAVLQDVAGDCILQLCLRGTATPQQSPGEQRDATGGRFVTSCEDKSQHAGLQRQYGLND